jgi:hypothetical protein
MLDLDTTNHYSTLPQIRTTLWHCGQCDAFLSIRSVHLLEGAPCPICGDVVLEFCGKLSSMPWVQFGDA